jgi:hypothetical protein
MIRLPLKSVHSAFVKRITDSIVLRPISRN